ncbi:MAG: GlsB/YeaQ/YmgE family stress response membrane protein [Actinomycetota bacterium]
MSAVDDIGFVDIIVYAIAGLVIGALARLILPGKQSMGWGLTMLIGVVSAIVGGLLWNAVFSGNEGIAWIGSIIVAIIIIVLYERVVAKRA